MSRPAGSAPQRVEAEPELLALVAEQRAGEGRSAQRDQQQVVAVSGGDRGDRRLHLAQEGRRAGHRQQQVDPWVRLHGLLGHPRRPRQEVEVGGLHVDVVEPGEQGGVVGRAGRAVVADRLEQVQPRAGTGGDDERLHLVEAGVVDQGGDVGQQRIEVRIDEVVNADGGGRRDEPQRGLDDDAHLALAGEQHLEQVPMTAIGARDDLAVAGDRNDRGDVVDLGAVSERHRSDPADRERAADRLADEVGHHRRHEPGGERRRQHLVPPALGADGDAVAVDRPDGVERRQVEGDRRGVLGLAERRVGGAATDDADVVVAGEGQHPGDVVDRAGPQDGDGPLEDDLAEVLARGRQRGIVQDDSAVEAG